MLRWELEHGPHLEYSLAQLRNGEDVPREAYSRPRLRPDAEWVWLAWKDLRRVCEGGTSPSEWMHWCGLHDVDAYTARDGWECARALDAVWLQHKADEREERRSQRSRQGNVGEG